MSIFFDFNVGPSGRRFRKAVDGDKSDIESIVNRQFTDRLFGTPDIGSLIELSTLAICMINENKEVTGFMALCDHPNVTGVEPADWEMWIRNMFQKFYLSRNTLFVHFMCCIDAATDTFLEEAFVSVFRSDVYLLNIVLVSCCTARMSNRPVQFTLNGISVRLWHNLKREKNLYHHIFIDWTTRYKTFKRHNVYKFYPKIDGGGERTDHIHVAMRNDFCPKLKIRRAAEEDNDDIVEMLGKNCPALQELYGNYYISEIIGRHPEMGRKIIVADYQDQAVGVMCLNSKINLERLQKTYELGPYHGLTKATPLEKENCKRSNTLLKTFGMPIMLGKWSPFKVLSEQDFIVNDAGPSKDKLMHKRAKGLSRVNFESMADAKASFEHLFYAQTSEDYSEKELISPSLSMTTCRSVANLLDDDPFDYEIVSIDNRLLNVPEVLSCQFFSSDVRNKICERPHAMQKGQDKSNRKSSTFRRLTDEEEELVTYSGDPIAFIIELFGLREDIDDRQSFHLLEIAFEMMKEYEYCVIRVPCKEKSFHLLEHFCFVPPKSKINSEYALYVAHRNSVLSKLRVRKAELIDIPQITQLLSNLDGRETLWTVENTILKKNELQCYVFLSGVALIGVGILDFFVQIVASGRNEAPAISDSAGGFRKLLDPYVSTYRTYHKPFTIEEQFGIGAKDQITFYSEFNVPKVRGFGPRHKEIWMPLTAKVHRGVYDRIHVKKEYKEVAACHNPVNNIKGVFESEMKKKYKVPFASSSLASWDHGEMFDLAPYPPNPYQTDIAPFMYCSDYCHIAQGTPPYTVIDQLKHNLKPRQKCVERFIVSRDFAP